MLTVMIAAGETLLRAGIDACVPWADLEAVPAGEAGDSEALLVLQRERHADLLILDSGMPGVLAGLRSLRAEDPRCAVILLTDADSQEIRAEARELGVSEVLVRPAIAEGDLRAAVKRVWKAMQPRIIREKETENRQIGAWRDFLFGRGRERLPFRAAGITVFRLFPDSRITYLQQRSVNELILNRIGTQPAYTHMRQEGCEVLIWREAQEKHFSRSGMQETLQYAQNSLKAHVGCVAIPQVARGTRFPFAARKAVAMLRDPRLFDCPVVYLDENERYSQERLDKLRREFMICQPFYRRLEEMSGLKALLDRFPEDMEEGMTGVLKRGRALLRELGIDRPAEGLDALTGQICEAAEGRLRAAVPTFSPKIRAAMQAITEDLSEPRSREEISRSVHYDGAYFSRLFRWETGMTYMDYLSELRMLRARDLLEESEKTYGEIAREIGLPNTSYFYKRFREFWGITPGEWREKSQK